MRRTAGYLGSVLGSVVTMVGLNIVALGSDANYTAVVILSALIGLVLGGFSDMLHRGLVSRAWSCAAMSALLLVVVYLIFGANAYVIKGRLPVEEFVTGTFAIGVVGAISGALFTVLAGSPTTRYPANR